MSAIVKFVFSVCFIGVAATPDICDETCLFQKDLKVAHRKKVSLTELEQSAATKSVSTKEEAAALHRPVASQSGRGALKSNTTIAKGSQSQDAKVFAEANSTFQEFFASEVEFELNPQMGDVITKNKLLLVLLEVTVFPAFFGVDRCYMGEMCMGVVKGLTLGGFGIWALLDNFAVFINSAQQKHSIDCLGMKAVFHPRTVHPAYVLTCGALSIAILLGFLYFCYGMCTTQQVGVRNEYEKRASRTTSDGVVYRSANPHGGIGVRRV